MSTHRGAKPITPEQAAADLAAAERVHHARLAKIGIRGGVDKRKDLQARLARADEELQRLTVQRAHLATQLAALSS